MAEDVERHSEALEPELIADPVLRAEREAANGLRQYDKIIEMVEYHLDPQRPFKLRVSHLFTLNRIALEGISRLAGVARPAGISIKGSKHEPIGAHLVQEELEHFCDYVNENWSKSALHLASYVLWRINWIHPFVDGNGRTSRVVSYLILSLRLGVKLPGTVTIPDLIAADKSPYYRALELADKSVHGAGIDLKEMEAYLESLLAKQLASVLRAANSVDGTL